PEPVTVIPAGLQRQALQAWPIAALRLPATAVERLQNLGILMVRQLLALPRSSLAARFGTATLQRIDQALGTTPDLLTPERPNEPVEAVCSFEEPINNRAAVELIFGQLIHRLLTALAARQEGIVQLH